MICIQTWLKNISEECCLASCYYYMKSNGKINKSDFLRFLAEAFDNGDISSDDCFVNNPNNLTKKLVYKANKNETGKPQIARFYNPRTGYSHFVIAGPDGKVIWNPLEKSITVEEGFIKDWRIIND